MSTQLPAAPGAVTVELGADGSGSLCFGGIVQRWQNSDLAEARSSAEDLLVAQAAAAGELAVVVREPAGVFELRVSPGGAIEPMGPAAVQATAGTHRVLHAGGLVPPPSDPPAGAVDAPGQGEALAAVVANPVLDVPGGFDDSADQVPDGLGEVDRAAEAESIDFAEAAPSTEAGLDIADDALPSEFLGGLFGLFDTRSCRACGCTDEHACAGGCWWVEYDLCSACLPAAVEVEVEDLVGDDAPVADVEDLSGPAADAPPTWAGVIEDVAAGVEPAAPARRRRVGVVAVSGVVLVGVAAGASAWLGGGPAPEPDGQWQADRGEQQWLAERRSAVAVDGTARYRQAEVAAAGEALAGAGAALEECLHADAELRASLASLIEQAAAHLEAGAAPASWHGLVRQLPGAVQAVHDSQAQWQADEDARAAAERAAAEQAAAEQRAAAQRSGATSKTPADSAPAPAGRGEQGAAGGASAGAGSAPAPSTRLEIQPGSISTGTGWAQASATTSGITGPVYLNIAGRSVYMGAGSGTFTARVDGLAPGTYSWSVSADGLVAHGFKQVAVS